VNGGIQLAPSSDGASVAVRLVVDDGGESLGTLVRIGVRDIVGTGVPVATRRGRLVPFVKGRVIVVRPGLGVLVLHDSIIVLRL
jgi:hypothetical protein